MIEEITMVGASCDHCQKDWYDDHNGWCAMTDENSMKNVLSDEGWHTGDKKLNEGEDGEHYCPECWGYDDNDNFVLDKTRKDKHRQRLST